MHQFNLCLLLILQQILGMQLVIMDNASYQSIMNGNVSRRKADIVTWLNLKKNIRFEESRVKTELLELIKQNEHKFKKFVVHDIAEKSGHAVLQLSRFHCILNPTALIWS